MAIMSTKTIILRYNKYENIIWEHSMKSNKCGKDVKKKVLAQNLLECLYISTKLECSCTKLKCLCTKLDC